MAMAPPLMVVEREPPVAMPKATASVSPWMNFTRSGSTPSRSTRIWVWIVAWPWPWEIEPVTSVSPPSGSKRISAVSMVGSAACSMVLEMPMPRSMPRLEARPIRKLHGAVEVLLEMPAVVGEDQRRLVGHGLRRDGVAPPQLRRIDAHLVGGDVDQPLDHV